MLNRNTVRIGGIAYDRTYSDAGFKIQSADTDAVYNEAYDPAGSGRQYIETSIPRDTEEYVEKATSYKKSYLAQWLYANGKYQDLKALVASDPQIEMFWETSTEFDSDHPQWAAILAGIQHGLGLADEQMESLLQYGEKGA